MNFFFKTHLKLSEDVLESSIYRQTLSKLRSPIGSSAAATHRAPLRLRAKKNTRGNVHALSLSPCPYFAAHLDPYSYMKHRIHMGPSNVSGLMMTDAINSIYIRVYKYWTDLSLFVERKLYLYVKRLGKMRHAPVSFCSHLSYCKTKIFELVELAMLLLKPI